MKQHLIILCITVLAVFGCAKEYSYENKNVEGTLKDSIGICMPVSASGTYKRDVVLTDSNYLSVQVRIKKRGYYSIYTNMQNGISFKDTGYITEGIETIQLKGSGRPTIAQSTTLKIIFGEDTCSYTIPIASGVADPANYTLDGSPGKCINAKVEGAYKVNNALSFSNKVIIQVNVLSTGSYSINTSANGMSFSSDGTFTSTGVKSVILIGSGTPTTGGSNVFNLYAGGTTCNFSIDVEAIRISALNKLDTAWSFNVGATKFFGPFDQAYTSGNTGSKFLYLKGITVLGDSAMSISIQLAGSTVEAGTYFTRTNPHFTFKDRYSLTEIIYRADPSTTTVELKVVITSFIPATGLIEGTFSGTAASETGTVNITGGRFKAEVD